MSDAPTPNESPAAESPAAPAEPAPEPKADGKPDSASAALLADLAKERKARQKLEKELEDIRRSQMSDTEKAVAEAEARGRTSALTEVGSRIAAAEIRAALTGVVADPASIIEDLNLARYVTESGEVDGKAVAALRDKYVAITAAAAKEAHPKVPAGRRGDGPDLITSRAQLQKMTPDEIVAAHREGRVQITEG